MKIGLAKTDITPRVGVELAGFGPYLNRYSIGIRDRLWARAMAVRSGEKTMLLVGCDLVGITPPVREAVSRLVREKTETDEDDLMISCTHTHSGPSTSGRRLKFFRALKMIWRKSLKVRFPSWCPMPTAVTDTLLKTKKSGPENTLIRPYPS